MKISRGGYTAPGGSTKLTQDYHFAYDIFGRLSGVAIGTDVKLAEYTYDHVTGNLLYMGYGNAGHLQISVILMMTWKVCKGKLRGHHHRLSL